MDINDDEQVLAEKHVRQGNEKFSNIFSWRPGAHINTNKLLPLEREHV